MKKESAPVWDIEPTTTSEPIAPTPTKATKKVAQPEPQFVVHTQYDSQYDMEGLMTDFPTATELQKFVYDTTGVVLSLKGRANKVKFQVALDVLNGEIPAAEFLGKDNPYMDRNEHIPEETLRVLPPHDKRLDEAGGLVTRFGTKTFPHPNQEWAASDQKCDVVFRKYANGIITYEILGPIAKRAVGSKINKFGVKQPERIEWIDPRTGEVIIVDENNKVTPLGSRLKGFMTKQRVNKSNMWDIWIDRDFVFSTVDSIDNPWGN
jgi:hypothetical protein